MKVFTSLFTCYFLASSTIILAQSIDCGTVEMETQAEKTQFQVINEGVYKYLTQQNTPKSDTIITLPIIVHVIQNSKTSGIADEQVRRGIQHLNDAFSNTNSYDRGEGVDTRIRFRLAQTTPTGAYTSGITRTISDLASIRFEKDDRALKNLIRWNTNDYINIWLVENIETLPCERGVTGYAKFPSSHGSDVDGIVCQAEYFGSNTSNSVVQIHEMGHYLGLLHTFEGLDCKNYDCLRDGDMVCDTPPDRLDYRSGRSCDNPPNSCNTDANSGFGRNVRDMISNYMDYEDLSCQHNFTAGQKERMRAMLLRSRTSLLTSNTYASPCETPISALFTANQDRIIFQTPVQFTSEIITGNRYEWYLNDQLVSTAAVLDYNFLNTGSYLLELRVTNESLGSSCVTSYQEQIEVHCTAEADFEVESLNIDPGDTLVLMNTSENATAIKWSYGDDSFAETNDLSLVSDDPRTVKVTLEAVGEGCTDEKTVTIQIGKISPEVSIELIEEETYCTLDSIGFSFEICNKGLASLPAGTPISFYEKNPILFAEEAFGYFLTTVEIPNNCCEIFTHTLPAPKGRLYLTLNDDYSLAPFSPISGENYEYKHHELDFSNNQTVLNTFELNPLDYEYFDTTACYNGDSVLLQSIEPEAYYKWSNGDTTSFVTVDTSGTHWVDLTYCGITKRHTYEITLRDCSCEWAIPNAFTPNNDDQNDIFRLFYNCEYQIEEFNMKIFSRWGNLVFETDDPEESWTAENSPSDTYAYVIVFTENYEGKTETHREEGRVLLIR
ncbi:MAG: M43 family zinc metalloprotease [Bacteroidota bacterium]